ncbi:MAG TPA: glycosyltransferase family 4 protein, partial [Ramlibacter sp.]|nr:glycosyltransferase family 4 protein [Ramlibacter sp.]
MTAVDHVPAHCPFTICYEGDAYSTALKVMGRQAAGQALMKAVAQAWPQGLVRGVGSNKHMATAMFRQLQADGFAGELKWSSLPDWQTSRDTGAVYYTSPPSADWAAARNLVAPAAFSLMGVTHSLSTHASMDRVAALVLPPFKPWDALICTSAAARTFVTKLHEEIRAYWQEHTGANRFVEVQLPVIPLGVDAAAFAPTPGGRAAARQALGLQPEDIAFLFAGRLAFQAKANPAPAYQALERIARTRPVVCIEAGVFANEAIRRAYLAAQQALAPSVRFIWVDGQAEAGAPADYRMAWQAADVFVSLADNVQETFGLTPLEAMAAGLPVVVSDWSGYMDTVRDGVDGYRIPTILPPPGVGDDLALRHALALDSYDVHVGRASLATVVEPRTLQSALERLARDAALRSQMGAAGRARALAEFDWPLILRRYCDFAAHLEKIRACSANAAAQTWPLRADPFRRFAHFATEPLNGSWPARARPDAVARLRVLLSLGAASFGGEPAEAACHALLSVLKSS